MYSLDISTSDYQFLDTASSLLTFYKDLADTLTKVRICS